VADVLVVGSGGREHALGWKLRQSPQVERLIFAPGNGGTALLENSENVPVAADDLEGLLSLARIRQPDLIIVGPEVPLSLGLADLLRADGFKVMGPGAAGAQIEASKAWAKEFMARHHIPTAAQKTFTGLSEAIAYLEGQTGPYVLKADGLAAGKGVLVTQDLQEATNFARQVIQERIFGESGNRLLVEEFMQGMEVSVLALCDTRSDMIFPFPGACDYKRVYDNDQGLNTGGMGAYCPTSMMTPELYGQVMNQILIPALKGFQSEKIDYRGILYAGLMLTTDGPRVVEFNCRFGDPETQVIIPLVKSDLYELLSKLAKGQLTEAPPLEFYQQVCVGVVLAAEGYPGHYHKGVPVTGKLHGESGVTLFHAGTTLAADGRLLTNGGRVFNVISTDSTIALARQKVYNAITEGVGAFEGAHFRQDIARREE
jgi:phosphoribosylamine--glycine ligase